MTEVIVFDVGGTLCEGSIHNFLKKAYRILDLPPAKRVWNKNEVIFDKRLNLGLITVQEAFEKFFGMKIPPLKMKKLVAIWTSNWVRSQEMKALVKRLGKSFRLAILSNSDPSNSPIFEKKGYYKPFEVVVLSHELHTVKPQKKIYQILLKRLKTTADKCLFIDDQLDCLTPAQKMGMKVIQFKNIRQLEKDLKAIM